MYAFMVQRVLTFSVLNYFVCWLDEGWKGFLESKSHTIIVSRRQSTRVYLVLAALWPDRPLGLSFDWQQPQRFRFGKAPSGQVRATLRTSNQNAVATMEMLTVPWSSSLENAMRQKKET